VEEEVGGPHDKELDSGGGECWVRVAVSVEASSGVRRCVGSAEEVEEETLDLGGTEFAMASSVMEAASLRASTNAELNASAEAWKKKVEKVSRKVGLSQKARMVREGGAGKHGFDLI
jgi:hypothetical protein